MENSAPEVVDALMLIAKRLDSIENRLTRYESNLEGLFTAPLLETDIIGGHEPPPRPLRERESCCVIFHDWWLFTFIL